MIPDVLLDAQHQAEAFPWFDGVLAVIGVCLIAGLLGWDWLMRRMK